MSEEVKNTDYVLEVENLHTCFHTESGDVNAVNGLSMTLEAGKTLGIVGESGSGKSVTAYSIMQILAETGEITEGSVKYKGEDITKWSERELHNFRGSKCSIIFQDPMTSLNPAFTVGEQIAESVLLHEHVSREEAYKKAQEMLELVGIPAGRAGEYPHQFSGGMRQRVVIAIALACNPKLLIADEPTTALDVTIQAQVIKMMRNLQKELNSAVILITHDLGVVANFCSKVAIVYAGEIVEYGTLEHIFNHVQHPYTKGLFDSLPSLDRDVHRLHPIDGLMPDPSNLPEGCKFHPRCPWATPECSQREPALSEIEPGHLVRCLLAEGKERAEHE